MSVTALNILSVISLSVAIVALLYAAYQSHRVSKHLRLAIQAQERNLAFLKESSERRQQILDQFIKKL